MGRRSTTENEKLPVLGPVFLGWVVVSHSSQEGVQQSTRFLEHIIVEVAAISSQTEKIEMEEGDAERFTLLANRRPCRYGVGGDFMSSIELGRSKRGFNCSQYLPTLEDGVYMRGTSSFSKELPRPANT